MRKPILSDIEDAHNAMAVICQRHYERELLRENDVVTAFLFALRNQGQENMARHWRAKYNELIPFPSLLDRSLKIQVQL
jgi:hypothetical protein